MGDISILKILIVTAASIPAGILAGNGAVYVFNRLPAEWLAEKVKREPGDQRVKSVPWKAFFTAVFIVAAIRLGLADWQYAIPAFIGAWLLLLLGLADRKYGQCPAPLTWLLLVTGLGYVSLRGMAALALGAGTGAAGCLILWLISKLIFGRNVPTQVRQTSWRGAQRALEPTVIGLGCGIGLACGWRGMLTVFALGGVIWIVLSMIHHLRNPGGDIKDSIAAKARAETEAEKERASQTTAGSDPETTGTKLATTRAEHASKGAHFVADLCLAAAIYMVVLYQFI